MKLDPVDQKILELLQANGRMTNAELARQIHMSPSPTLERVKKLERKGYIRKYVALVDPEKVGIKCFTYVEVTLVRHGKEAVQRFMNSITRLSEVLECHHITGDADFLLKVVTRDIPAYEDFILHTLTALPDVQHLKTLVVLSTLKQETQIPINGGNHESS
jgi:DNA-binding Lrp family transcriptional regulator